MPSYAAVTITFNPAVDKSTSVPSLAPEKKLACAAPLLQAGGGGINVARAIHKLGGEALALFPAGGYNGGLLKRLLDAEGVASQPLPIAGDTRENLVVLDSAANLQYRFGMPGPRLSEAENRQCLLALEQQAAHSDFLVASGSLSPGMPVDMLARVASIAKKKKVPLVLDSSGPALAAALEEGVFLIKPNVGELAALAGCDELGYDSITGVARGLIAKGRCQVVVVSMGRGGAMLVTAGLVRYVLAPPVKKVSSIGAGDSMVGGIVLALHRGRSIAQAVRFGVACGTAATLHPGTGLCSREDAERLYKVMDLSSEVCE